MLALIVVLCVIGHPSDCIESRQVPEDDHDLTIWECAGPGAQIIALTALDQHPGMYVAGTRCRVGKPA
jgi:hypothetical protein